MSEPEVWLRGPVAGVPGLVQPVAHALLQAREELHAALREFPDALLSARPAGAASVGFHLRHIAGVLDRLFTYARGTALDERQRAELQAELRDDPASTGALLRVVDERVERALDALRAVDPDTLLDARAVGRARLPSNVLGLLFHAAEHTQRHVGQLLVTARVAAGGRSS